jgi:beta-mannanase
MLMYVSLLPTAFSAPTGNHAEPPEASLLAAPGSGQMEDDFTIAAAPSDFRAVTRPPVALGVYQPGFPDDMSALRAYEQTAGRTLPIVHWYAHWGDWKSAFSRADLDKVAARGSVPMITWEPWRWDPAATTPDPAWSLRNGILAGRFDDYIDSWARGLAAYGQPVMLRFAHEMHDNSVYPWAVGTNGNTAEEYVASWRHVRAIFARYDTSNVRWVWNPHTIGNVSAAVYEPVYRSVYPGDDYVDWVGLDIYNTGPDLDWGTPYWRTFSQALAEPYKAITALTNKPVMLPELGCTEAGGAKADWITSALTSELAQFPRVRAVVWFDVNKEQRWDLHSSPLALRAWGAATRSGLFAVNSPTF